MKREIILIIGLFLLGGILAHSIYIHPSSPSSTVFAFKYLGAATSLGVGGNLLVRDFKIPVLWVCILVAITAIIAVII